jgi:EmrB/QacA subfamily drug resistance transporter
MSAFSPRRTLLPGPATAISHPSHGSQIDPRRYLCLAVVVAAQFMFVVDAFIVNVAIPSIRADLAMSEAGIEAVIALYQIAFATLVIIGGRLGDLRGRRNVFLVGMLGFTAASMWCGLARSGGELIAARLAQGAAAALMSPQVLATIHTLFPDEERKRAFAVFGISLGLGGAAGVLIGGWLLALNPFGLGWRLIFFVNGPIGLAIAIAAWRLLPVMQGRREQRLDLAGATLLFLGLLGVITPVLCGRELHWAWWLGILEAGGIVTLVLFLAWERRTERKGAQPLIDLDLLSDRAFLYGLLAALCFFAANISFYFVLTVFLQNGMGLSPFHAGLTVLPLALAFVVGSRVSGDIVRGCVIQIAGLAAIGGTIAGLPSAGAVALIPSLVLFGYGQGRVMAPLFGAVLANVRHAHAGAGSGVLTTAQQTANASGVALIGLVYFSVRGFGSSQAAILTSLAVLGMLVLCTALSLRWMQRAP